MGFAWKEAGRLKEKANPQRKAYGRPRQQEVQGTHVSEINWGGVGTPFTRSKIEQKEAGKVLRHMKDSSSQEKQRQEAWNGKQQGSGRLEPWLSKTNCISNSGFF